MAARNRRILVAVDASPGSRAALRRAAELARRMHAELTGLFVEDENLVRLAGLPFARELSASGGPRRELSPQGMEQEMARQAASLRAELEQLAAPARIPWHFRTARGRVIKELLSASAEHELIALGMVGSLPGHARLGSTARHLLAEARCPVLLISPNAKPRGAVLAVYDGSASSQRALEHASHMLNNGTGLEVLLWSDSREKLQVLEQEARRQLGKQAANFHALVGGAGQALGDAVLRLAPATLIIGESAHLDRNTLTGLVEKLDGAILQVREARES